jgi:hypothetical protein
MDGHTHIYGERLTREYEEVISLRPGWQEILAKYRIGWVIVRTDAPLAAALASSPGWQIRHVDHTAAILTRKQSPAP